MSLPDIIIECAFGNNAFTALSALTWTDITADVLIDPALGGGPITIRRGRQSELGRVEAGALSLMLNNNARKYDPTNTASPYYPNVRPMTRIRVRARWPATTGTLYTIYTGHIEAWTPSYPGPQQAIVQVRASDVFTAIARAIVSITTIAPGELSHFAIATALNQIGFPYLTDYDSTSAGQTRIAPGSYLNLNALQYMQNIIATENGLLFVLGNGRIKFQDRHWRINNATVMGVFGDGTVATTLSGAINSSVTTIGVVNSAAFASSGVIAIDGEQIIYTGNTGTSFTGCIRGANSTTAASHVSGALVGELPYADLQFSYDESLLYNDVKVTRAGGAEQEAIDTTSQTNYGPRALPLSGLYMQTDDEALGLAQWELLQYKDPHLRITSIVLNGELSPISLWPIILSREISDKIEVRRRPPPAGALIDQFARVEAIGHTIGLDSWLATWQLSLAAEDQWWVLDSTTLSVLDSTTKLAF